MTERHNIRHWTDDKRGVYEVWYMTWNHPGTDQGFWLRYITEAPVDGPLRGELWFARFDPANPSRTFGIHKRFSADQLQSAADPFALSIAGSRLGHDHANGRLSGNGHDVSWDLRWDAGAQVLRLLPNVMYARGGLGETTVVTPNPRVALSGSLVVDGEKLTFDRATLGQTHLWGKKHAYSWTWGRCAEFAGAPDALLEILGVRLQRRGTTLPPMMLVCLDLDGEQYRLNQFRHVVRNRGTWADGRVTFSAWSPTVKIEGELTCTPDQMVVAPYLDPDGTEVFCSNTEIGDARVTVYRRSGLGWREHRTIEGKRRAHFELGSRVRDPAVTREQTLVP
ncbi:MAG TPA: tocopherol cyclase family protein [Kofleriaceae bacterium]